MRSPSLLGLASVLLAASASLAFAPHSAHQAHDRPLAVELESPDYASVRISGAISVDFSQPSPTWTPAPGFPVARTDMLQARTSDGTVMAITHGRGVFTAPFRPEPVANAPGPAGTADAHRLTAAAPNPFRDQARFTLRLAAPQQVRLTLLDLQGRRVRLLHEGALAAGEHPFTVDGRGLPAGAYLVAAEGERFRDHVRLTRIP